MHSRIRTPFYIFFLNPDYVAARSLRSLRSNKADGDALTSKDEKPEGCQQDLYLHCTSSEAALEVSWPRLLLATHRYFPLSVLFTFVIVNCFLSRDKLILVRLLFVLLISDPSLVHEIVGTGFPLTLLVKVTLSPSSFVSFFGWTVISGLSVMQLKYIWKNDKDRSREK